MLGRGAQPADRVVVDGVQGAAGKREDPQRRGTGPVSEPGFQAGGGITQQDNG
jgi:hypothetical protein